jgi:ABC-type uncharacterized transport system permease subunit
MAAADTPNPCRTKLIFGCLTIKTAIKTGTTTKVLLFSIPEKFKTRKWVANETTIAITTKIMSCKVLFFIIHFLHSNYHFKTHACSSMGNSSNLA